MTSASFAHHLQQVGPRRIGRSEQFGTVRHTHQSRLHGIFGVVLIARHGNGQSHQPLRRQIKERTQDVDVGISQPVRIVFDSCRKIPWSAHKA